MSKYKFYHGLWLSLYSKDFYKDVAKNWKAKAFLTLILLLVICWIPDLIEMDRVIAKNMKSKGMEVISQMPEITIVNGRLSIDKEMPYFVTSNETTICVFDTTGKYNSLKDIDASILVTEQTVYMKKSEYEVRSYDLSQIPELNITKQKMKTWAELFVKYFALFLLPFVLLFSFIYRGLLSVLYALLGLIVKSILKKEIEFNSIVQISVLSMILPIILSTIFSLLKVHIPFFWLISFVISMGYIFFGISGVENKEIGEV